MKVFYACRLVDRGYETLLNKLLLVILLVFIGSANVQANEGTLKSSKEKKASLKAHSIQSMIVKGQVLDSQVSSSALQGVSVMIKGTPKGTTTDANGYFELEVSAGDVLVFTSVGFVQQEYTVKQSVQNLKITLEDDLSSLEEVVVVGYGTQKAINLTGAVDVIEGDVIQDRSSPTVSQLLQEASPGLSFDIGNSGFQPGASLGIKIRGMGSLNGGEPYVVIDGIPGELDRLNPDDIESVSVLKDAAASAIYGARAPFGVIVVTTKSGRTGKLKISYSGNVSTSSPERLPSMLNSYLHNRVYNEAGVAGDGGRFVNDIVMDNVIAYQKGDFDHIRNNPYFPQDATHFETVPQPGNPLLWAYSQNSNSNHDWFDIMYGHGLIQKHNINLAGGSEKTKYYFSVGSYGQSGVLNYGTDTYDRYNVMAKITTALNDNWDITYQPFVSKSAREYPNYDYQGNYDLIFHQIARTFPSEALYDGYGNYGYNSKIPLITDAGTDRNEITENTHTFSTEFRPLNGWKINADYTFRNNEGFIEEKNLTAPEYHVDGLMYPVTSTIPSSYMAMHTGNAYWTSNVYTSYSFNLSDNHNFNLLIGTQFEKFKNRNLSSFKTNILVPEVPSLSTSDGEIQSFQNLNEFSTQGYFGRFNYNYKEKYLFEGNARYDGSSRFSKGNRWGFFPSFSMGWNIDKEPFWDSFRNVVNNFKIKGSWGELGNQNVSPYQDLLLIPLSSNFVSWIFESGGSRPAGYANTPSLVSTDLTWETARTMNYGADMSFLDRRLNASFDWFERTTYNMLGPVNAQPGVLGSSAPQANNSTLRTRGWELNIAWRQFFESGFSYNLGINLYDSKTIVTKYFNPTGLLSTWYKGKEEGEIWGYTAHDLYKTQDEIDAYTSKVDLSHFSGLAWRTGDLKYEDINGDGVVDKGSNTLDNHGDLKIIGNSTPHYQFGVNIGAAYKGFDFSLLLRGVAKRDLWFDQNQNIFWAFRTGSQSSLFPHQLDYFRDQPGDKYTGVEMGDANFNLNAYFPRPYLTNQNNKNRSVSTRYLQNGAYLKVQNIQIGYTFSDEIIRSLKFSSLKLYASAESLYTFTKVPIGIDPIAVSGSHGAGKTHGSERILSFGLKVSY